MLSRTPQGETLAWFWAAAPMPRPALWLAREGALIQLPSDEPAPADGAVSAAMRNADTVDDAAPAFLAMRDSAGELWRMKCHGLPDGSLLWQTQTVERTRALLFNELRAALAAMLISPIRHELSGTVQTLSLSADIAMRLLEKDDGDRRLAENLEVIRRRLLDLHRRQSATLELWLADPAKACLPTELKLVLESAASLLRGHLAMAGSQLLVEDLSALDDTTLSGAAGYAGIGILALLLLLGPQAVPLPNSEKHRQAMIVRVSPDRPQTLELENRPKRAGLPQFAGMEGFTALATIAALLDAAGLELSSPGVDRVIRLRPRTDPILANWPARPDIDADYPRE